MIKNMLKPELFNVTIIIPCRNEEEFIGKCFDSIIAQSYPKDKLEVLIVDGMSRDGTREIVKKYTKEYPFIKLLDNINKITPASFNIGIRYSTGDIILIMGAHATYESEYVSKCISYLIKYNADNVGGIWKIVPRDESLTGKAIAAITSSPFGAGNAHYRTGSLKQPMWVDTVFGGCYKKQIFERIGLFNENLVRTQDLEFHLRLKKAGGKILLVPDIITYYYVRSDLKSFCEYNFTNSFWVTYPRRFLNYIPASWRHFVPMIFVVSLMISMILSIFSVFPLAMITISYLIALLFFTSVIVYRKKDVKLLYVVPLLFPLLHISYGLGSLWGLIRSFGKRRV